MNKQVLCTIVLLSQSLLFAQEASKTKVSVDLGETVIEGYDFSLKKTDVSDSVRLNISAYETPLFISEYGVEEIEMQGNVTLKDALWNFAGVTSGTGNGVHDFFVIRGVDSLTGALVMYDRVPEPEATFYSLYNVEKIQVVKGAASFLFGANSTSGAVNLIRKTPHDTDFTQMSFGFGSYNTYEQSLDYNVANLSDRLSFRLNVLALNSDGYRDDMVTERYGINPSFRYDIDDDSLLEVQLEYTKNRSTPDAGLPIYQGKLINAQRTTSYQDPSDYSDQEYYRLQIDYTRQLSDVTTLTNKVFYTDAKWDSSGVVFAGIDIFGFGQSTTLSRYKPSLDDHQTIYGDYLELTHVFDDGNVEHELLTGLALTRYSNDYDFKNPAFTDIDTVTKATAVNAFLPDQPSKSADATLDWLGLYALDTMKVTQKFSVMFGARFNWFDYQDSDASALDKDDTLVSPMAGATYALNDNILFFANVMQGYAPPSSFQRTDGAVDPERGRNIEGGLKWQDAASRTYGQVSWFQLDREDVPVSTTPSGFLNETGDTSTEGIELEFGVKPLDNWLVYGTWTYQDSTLDSYSESLGGFVLDRSGNDTPFVPEQSLRLWSDYELPNGFGIGGGATYVGSQKIAPDNGYTINAYTTYDAVVYYRETQWEASVNFKNLTNEQYDYRGISSTSVIPADGFNFLTRISYKF
jgi:TonB-dependent siderophore receptor